MFIMYYTDSLPIYNVGDILAYRYFEFYEKNNDLVNLIKSYNDLSYFEELNVIFEIDENRKIIRIISYDKIKSLLVLM